MSIEIRDYDTMVDAVLTRIVNSNVGITNTNVGSVIRTLVEAIVVENDIEYYQIQQVYNALGIDDAQGDDLDRLVSILGVVRKPASKCPGSITFGRSTASASDIAIEYSQIISTKPDINGNVTEFIVSDSNAKLLAGNLTVTVNVEAVEAGIVYIPSNTLTIMNTPIIGIEYVNNDNAISGGSDVESDDNLRERAKTRLSSLGKGTNSAIRSALLEISGVTDVMMIDMSRGVGTSDAVVVTSVIPPSTELSNIISATISSVKPSGIDVDIIYPTIVTVPVTVTTTGGNRDTIGNAILSYFSTLGIANTFIINQMERTVLTALDDTSIDITTTLPANNINVTGTQIIRNGTITINGTAWSA